MAERIQLSRRKGWRKPENTVVVARPSRWGNPFPVSMGRDLAIALFSNMARGMWNPFLLADLSDDEYAPIYESQERWRRRINGHPLEVARAELRGKNLACWCALDQACHADVLLALANPADHPEEENQ